MSRHGWHNNRIHPTRNSVALKFKGSSGRVMREALGLNQTSHSHQCRFREVSFDYKVGAEISRS